ncbi:tRNA:m(4)X modification enzyme TRM13 isoform X2 [Cryptomeria japonica]|uniref:tRNA:m(4)X modification enzyme TRM13 isoform X2 n=1 Tax=Cryptomeria japonica TaxID=3369 RepID=UPI0025ABD32C|nr:tRNA:m(4)X modification enzyme TRM13 isoform X2 [Cryptomeria japonica]
MEQQCQFWLPKKKRLCANFALLGSQFCGNHKPDSVESRIPCPIDPSHTILQVDVAAHVKKCPLVKQIEALKLKPYYEEGINSGSDGEDDSNCSSLSSIHGKCTLPREVEGIWTSEIGDNASFEGDKVMDEGEYQQQVMWRNFLSSSHSDNKATQSMKRKAIFTMSGDEFYALVEKIESAHLAICQNNIDKSYFQPNACDKGLNAGLDRRLPFQEKHAIQQASILGNLEMMGIIRRLESVSETIKYSESGEGNMNMGEIKGVESQLKVIEFGAGRGYLTHMLFDCYGIKDIVLVERRSYKFKADRTLRQADGVNLERLRIDIKDLKLEAVESLKGCHYTAVGKHLCGPATDLALRCCLHGSNRKNISEDMKRRGSCPYIKGLAIATCCHHLCQWKSYVNKRFFLNLGFTREEFCAITWFTSWALDGEHSSEHSDAVNCETNLPVW